MPGFLCCIGAHLPFRILRGDAAGLAWESDSKAVDPKDIMSAVAQKQQRGYGGVEPADLLLAWYDRERRHLPWRSAPGDKPNPYHVWLSEVMLQQTTVKAVIPFFLRFLATWPTVEALASASLDQVLVQWAGLGYYSRARNLHACAQAVVSQNGGAFPTTEAELQTLPGIGPYTAAAIVAIAFGAKASPVDGNIERVMARLFAVAEPMPAIKPRLRTLARSLTPDDRAGDFAQALMDLGATVCTPKRPSCLMCPLTSCCAGYALGTAAMLPRRAVKAARPVRHGQAFVALREDGHVLLRRRPNAGLLGGMMEVPSSAWLDTPGDPLEALRTAPVGSEWWPVSGLVGHTFTHFRLEMRVLRSLVSAQTPLNLWAEPERCRWVHRRDLDGAALPSVMRKIIAHALSEF